MLPAHYSLCSLCAIKNPINQSITYADLKGVNPLCLISGFTFFLITYKMKEEESTDTLHQ